MFGQLPPAPVVDGLSSATRTKLDCLHAGYLPGIHGKSQQSANQVPSIVTAGAGIHVNQAERLVAHNFQNVGVTADEQTRPQPREFLSGTPVVITRISANMGHVDGDARAVPNEILGQVGAEFRSVNVPVNSANRFEGSQAIQYFQ